MMLKGGWRNNRIGVIKTNNDAYARYIKCLDRLFFDICDSLKIPQICRWLVKTLSCHKK